MIETVAALFILPFLTAPLQEDKPLRNVQILQNDYPVVEYYQKDYIPYEMLQISHMKVDCNLNELTIFSQTVTNISTGKVLNHQSETKTYLMDTMSSFPVCNLKNLNTL